MVLRPDQRAILAPLARRYIWWQPPERSLDHPHRLLAQVMNIGDWHDVQGMCAAMEPEALRQVLAEAQPGEFSRRSWNFWHLRLGLPHGEDLPELPRRNYGGTALALRTGHRVSVDFDFFANPPLDRRRLWDELPALAAGTLLQEGPDVITSLVRTEPSTEGSVKLSLFGGLELGRVGESSWTEDGVARVASLEDLMATKLKVILQRAEAKDYLDIAVLLDRGITLGNGLAGAAALYGSAFQPSEALKALVYFEDGDLPHLPGVTRRVLCEAVAQLKELPPLPPVHPRLV
jgi:hypothetical protein